MTTNHDHLREVATACCNNEKAWSAWLVLQNELAALRKENEGLRVASGRYIELCRQIDTADPVSNEASTLRNIIDDAINLGSECLHLHLDAARAAIGDSHE
jgi:hypothetical protein